MFNDEVRYNGKTILRIIAVKHDERRAAVFTPPIDCIANPINETTQRALDNFIKKSQEFELRQSLMYRYFNTDTEDRFFSNLLSGAGDVSVMVEEGTNMTQIAHYFVTWARNYSPMWDFS